MKEKDTAEPTVINDDLVRDYMVKYKEEAKIYDKRDTPFEDFTHLALSFLSKTFITQISLRSTTSIAWSDSKNCNWTTTSSIRSKISPIS